LSDVVGVLTYRFALLINFCKIVLLACFGILKMFKIISHTADVGIDISGTSLEELFIEAARGWKQCVLEDSPTKSAEERRVELNADSLEDLMVRWLNELNYFLTVHRWILHEVEDARVHAEDPNWKLDFLIMGEPMNFGIHEICMEIKSVTYHQLEIQELNGLYKTRIIFDI
jgi:SHS2 domain-containing protein